MSFELRENEQLIEKRVTSLSLKMKVCIVGGGLVGSLAAVYLAERGYEVHVFEKRQDIRQDQSYSGRSINLALSHRGLSALGRAGLDLSSQLIPMKGRMIHTDGRLTSQAYGVFGECINSVDRKYINQVLLDIAEKLPNVFLHFNVGLETIQFDEGILNFKTTQGQQVQLKQVDLIIGCDGAYSRTRVQMMRQQRMNYQQTFIDHGYVELHMPPGPNGEYLMDPQHLHIWPRQTFMMIALPNQDKSFTITLFMPFQKFDEIKNEQDLMHFFETYFKDSIPLIGREKLVKDYFGNPKGPLISVKCKPYHYKSRCVILGDAAHAMVPFYGQGMNCGFEDVAVLDQILTKVIGEPKDKRVPTKQELQAVLEEYTETRNADAEAIVDLAMYNYVEMRSSVTKMSYIIRNKIERFLHRLFPSVVKPLYTMVSFTNMPYSQAMKQFHKQTRWFENGIKLIKFCGLGLFAYGLYKTDAVRRLL
ncbi:hypothetical protein EDD86DRAFT_214444 [Gorgonomyces haynaldii]|nr:hypothetical protein EDD86DRAFT_214444 [Gorgonomyces haynaldii]